MKFLYNWDKLSPAARAEAILQIIESTCRILTDVADLLVLFREHPLEVASTCRRWARRMGGSTPRVQVPGEEARGSIIDDEKMARVNPEAGEAPLDMQMGRVTSDPAIEDKLTKRFKLGAKAGRFAIQAVVIVANCAVAVSLGLQIAREWGHEDLAIVALDIITLYVTYGQTVVEVAELVFIAIGAESVAIPIAGAVLAILGVILSIIE